jgi:integrase
LDVPQPFIDVRTEITKSRKPAILPLVPMLADALRTAKVRGEKHLSGLVFKGRVPEVQALAKDLVACGIPVEDERGFRVDFHAFRHTFASLLATAGVSELARVKLARHSEWRMTDRYTDPRSIPLFREMQKLAEGFPTAAPSSEAPSPIASLNSGKTGPNLSGVDQIATPEPPTQTSQFSSAEHL